MPLPKPILALWHLPRRTLILLVRGYQILLSPILGPGSCRFRPTCSQYSIEALRNYGVLKGSILSIWRILRCNPWATWQYDPPRWFGEPHPDEPAALHDPPHTHADGSTLH